MEIKSIELYDSINTTTVRWLTWIYKEHKKPLLLCDFNYRDLTHLWLIHMLEAFSVYNGYCNYYVDCSFFRYLHLRFIKHFKHIRMKSKYIYTFDIVINDFIKEILDSYRQPKSTILKMYNLFWGTK